MAIKGRLKRLEKAASGAMEVERQKSLYQATADFERLWAWLNERGFADCLAAQEAGETGPAGLEEQLREQAAHDSRRRAFSRIEAALQAGRLPDTADVELIEARG
jgi:hypothetical protein